MSTIRLLPYLSTRILSKCFARNVSNPSLKMKLIAGLLAWATDITGAKAAMAAILGPTSSRRILEIQNYSVP